MLATVLFVTLLGPAHLASAAADTSGIEYSVSPKLEGFYSPSRGVGVGLSHTVRNLGIDGSELTVDQTTMVRHGEYHAFFFSADPYRSAWFFGLGMSYVGTRARTFYGTGPRSHRDDGVRMALRTAAAEARVGWYPDRLVLVQPVVRWMHGNLRYLRDEIPGGMDPASVEQLLRAEANPTYGLEYGLDLVLGRLDDHLHPHRGVTLNLAGRRHDGFGEDAFTYHSAAAVLHGAIPVRGERTILEGRAIVRVTRELGDRTPPFYVLPTVDGELVGGYPRYRFVGRDLLALSVGIRFPVLDVLNFVGAEGFIAVHAANAYHDLFRELEPSVSFSGALDRVGATAPLRPSLTLGGHLMNLPRRRAVLSGQIGISPEGWELAGLTFTVDLRQRRPFVR